MTTSDRPTEEAGYAAATRQLQQKLTGPTLARIGSVYGFHFEDGTSATLDGSGPDGRGWVEQPPAALGLTPDFEVTLTRADFARLVFGTLHPMAGMATGRMRLTGSFKEAIKLDRLLKA